jgi:hypothetical protein
MKGMRPMRDAVTMTYTAQLDGKRAPKKGRPRIEDRAKTIEARQPWLELGMSRRTRYRRQAEKRAGRA